MDAPNSNARIIEPSSLENHPIQVDPGTLQTSAPGCADRLFTNGVGANQYANASHASEEEGAHIAANIGCSAEASNAVKPSNNPGKKWHPGPQPQTTAPDNGTTHNTGDVTMTEAEAPTTNSAPDIPVSAVPSATIEGPQAEAQEMAEAAAADGAVGDDAGGAMQEEATPLFGSGFLEPCGAQDTDDLVTFEDILAGMFGGFSFKCIEAI